MARKRRTRWIDAISTDAIALAGAVAPGTVVNRTLLTEAELETIADGATLIRTVGSVNMIRTAGSPVVTLALWFAPNYPAAVFPADWTQDVFEREKVFQTEMWHMNLGSNSQGSHRMFDVRSKRRVSPGQVCLGSFQNHSVAGNDAQFTYHLRFLMLLP